VILGWGAGLQYFLITCAVGGFLYFRGLFFAKAAVAVLSIGSFAVLAFLYGTTWSTGQLPDHVVVLVNQASILVAIGLIPTSLWIFSSRLESFEVQLEQAHAETQRLLHNILPPAIAEKLKISNEKTVERLDEASILFADIVGFTHRAATIPAGDLVNLLNGLFTRFDDGIDEFHLEKIKTIGDAYMVAAGVPQPCADHARELTDFARWILRQTDEFNRKHGTDLHIRIGICSGPVIAGVIGHKKFAYDLWGDTVNMAARMEQTGIQDKIQVTESTFQLLDGSYRFVQRDDVEIKGKGSMRTYILEDSDASKVSEVA
jgi:class 3 adenylate cyclase